MEEGRGGSGTEVNVGIVSVGTAGFFEVLEFFAQAFGCSEVVAHHTARSYGSVDMRGFGVRLERWRRR